MQKKFYLQLRSIGIACSFILYSLLNFSFVPARNSVSDLLADENYRLSAAINPFTFDPLEVNSILRKFTIYDSLNLDNEGLDFETFDYALRGYEKLLANGQAKKSSVLSIVDFSQPSVNKRLYVIDLDNYELLYRTYVSHGRNSGNAVAKSFSNQMSSYQSSLGFYVTSETYRGKHGYSLRLEGMERGLNDNARKRAIVMHSASYADEGVIKQLGYLGRSQGCPAIPVAIHKQIINQIKDGSCLFIYHPSYLSRSKFII